MYMSNYKLLLSHACHSFSIRSCFRLLFEPQAISPAVVVTLDPRQRARRKQI
jgi:hypothetical protein